MVASAGKASSGKDKGSRIGAQIWVAVIGALASVAVAFITAYFQAKPAAADALDKKAARVEKLQKDIASLKQEGAALKPVPVGTIVASMLSPRQMNEEAGNLWVPADGRNSLPTWSYTQLTGETKVPDLRGMFLRGVNDSDEGIRNDGKQDPDVQRRPGTYQGDGIAAHGHTLSLKAVAFTQAAGTPNFASNIFTEGGFNTGVSNSVGKQSDAAEETRPRNIAVRWYIKVN